jgi:multidrug efflux pump
MQPVQDLTIEDRVAARSTSSAVVARHAAAGRPGPELVQRLRAPCRSWPMWPATCRTRACRPTCADRPRPGQPPGRDGGGHRHALYNAFGQRLISTIFTQSNQYRVVLEVAPQFKLGPEALNSIYVPSSDGKPVPLSSVAASKSAMPLAMNHVGQLPAATISFNTVPGRGAGRCGRGHPERGGAAAGSLPLSVDPAFQGAALAFQASLSNTLLLILAAVVTMYIVLGVLYESYIHPVTILSTLPSAGVGALLALLAGGQ